MKKIFIVEDDSFQRQMYKELLAALFDEEFHFVENANMHDAKSILATPEGECDLYLLDGEFPGGTGAELVPLIEGNHMLSQTDFCIVALSGSQDELKKFKSLGISHRYMKPFGEGQIEDFAEIVRKECGFKSKQKG